MDTTETLFYPALQAYCQSLESEFSQISEERKATLHQLGDYISEKIKAATTVNLTFICTHNSRRSQFGQVWAKVAAAWYGLSDEQVQTWSGGTEVTAFNENAVSALLRVGFGISSSAQPQNPHYSVSFSEAYAPLDLFSKVYQNTFNPSENYCALMVCTSADDACPIVSGADLRISLPYTDPKQADGTAAEREAYDAACRRIAREMFYVFAYTKQLTSSD